MSKQLIETYVFKCDCCGEFYDDGDGATVFDNSGADFIEEAMIDDGWEKDGDKHYCPKCIKRVKSRTIPLFDYSNKKDKKKK